MSSVERAAATVERTFERVRVERMSDVPILNAELAVQAVGFRDWRGDALGVLVTPWCMNVMLLPGDSASWPAVPVGTTATQELPAGSFDFIEGEEDGVGRYRMCSLFSPMHEFGDQATAVATAEAALAALLTDEQAEQIESDSSPARPLTRRELFQGRAPAESG